MCRIILLSLAAGLALGLAVAAGASNSDAVTVGEGKASLKQDITVAIPPRYALHLTSTKWVLDLGNLAGQNCFLVPKDVKFRRDTFKDFQRDWLLRRLDLSPTQNYPAFIQDKPGGEVKKGSLICLISKVLQKFTNVPDWQLEATFVADEVGFGYFLLSDFVERENKPPLRILALGTRADDAFASTDREGTTGGWLNGTLVEGFWFDGTEVAGTYNITITFTLTHM